MRGEIGRRTQPLVTLNTLCCPFKQQFQPADERLGKFEFRDVRNVQMFTVVALQR